MIIIYNNIIKYKNWKTEQNNCLYIIHTFTVFLGKFIKLAVKNCINWVFYSRYLHCKQQDIIKKKFENNITEKR